MGLRLDVSRNSPEAPYRQLVRQLKRALASRALRPGDRLPSVRVLARELRLSANTVARGYRELESEGLIAARAGGGTRVNAVPSPAGLRQGRGWQLRATLRPLVDKVVAEGRQLGLSSTEIRSLVNAALLDRRGQ